MKPKRKQSFRLAPASEIHLEAVRAFLVHYCGDMEFQNRALGAIRARDWKTLLQISDSVSTELQIAGSTCVPTQSYGDLRAFSVGMQFVALVGKYQYSPDEIPGLDPNAAAIENLLKAERRNRRLNTVFRAHRERGTERHWSVPLVREVFCRVLGRKPDFDSMIRLMDFSGGASVSYTGDRTHLARKLSGQVLRGRSEALDFFKEGVWQNSNYARQFLPQKTLALTSVTGEAEQINIVSMDFNCMSMAIDEIFEAVDYNKLEVVPKNAKSGRTIAKEAEVNNFCQKGLDLVMRRNLLRMLGLDLSRQEPNQHLAWLGSQFTDDLDPYVTLDVKDASNGVLRESIRAVTPPVWFNTLDKVRSPRYVIDDAAPVDYEMFCSMGNGFCFPLETLLFAAICEAAYKHCGAAPDYRCYGDDIIVRRSVALVVTECLHAFGFKLNKSKSFIFGPFRESCGANWYQGKSCTPGYYKEPVTCLTELIAQHNSLAAWPEVQRVLRAFAPKGGDFYVPEGRRYGWVTDQAFRVPFDIAMTSSHTHYHRHYASWHFGLCVSAPVADSDWRAGFRLNDPEDLALTAVLRGSKDFEAPFHCRHKTRTRASKTSVSTPAKAPSKWWTEQHVAHVALWALHGRRRDSPGYTRGAIRSFLLRDRSVGVAA